MITDDQIKLMIGSLLHDIGKVVYRSGDGRNHSQSGYEIRHMLFTKQTMWQHFRIAERRKK